MGAARVTESEYTTIKQLLAKGYEGQKVAEIVGRARGIVSRVKNSSGYKDYIAKGKVSKKPEPKQLPLDTPKKTNLDAREDIAVKYDALYTTIIGYKIRMVSQAKPKEYKAYQIALERLEEARLWLKEAL